MSRHQLRLTALLALVLAACEGASSQGPEENPATRKPKATPFALAAALRPVQTRNTKALGTGKLLVASRSLGDPHFARTVVLLVHSDANGAVGLILNRRSKLPISRVLKDVKAAKDRSDPVYVGGPVEMPSVYALLQTSNKIEGAERVTPGVYWISEKNLFQRTLGTKPDPAVFHVYLGYAGWSAAQLRAEVGLGAWFIFPGDKNAIFNADPDSLWLEMIRKTELNVADSRPSTVQPPSASF